MRNAEWKGKEWKSIGSRPGQCYNLGMIAFPRLQRRQGRQQELQQSDDESTKLWMFLMIMNYNRIQSVFDADDEARNNN